MIIGYRLYPYLILSDFNYDYINSQFVVEYNVEVLESNTNLIIVDSKNMVDRVKLNSMIIANKDISININKDFYGNNYIIKNSGVYETPEFFDESRGGYEYYAFRYNK